MLDEIFKGIGMFAVFIIGGAWLMRHFEEKNAAKYRNSMIDFYKQVMEEQPAKKEECLREIARLMNTKRVGLFEDPYRRRGE